MSLINLGIAAGLGKRKIWIQPLQICWKTNLESYPAYAKGLANTNVYDLKREESVDDLLKILNYNKIIQMFLEKTKAAVSSTKRT